MTNPRAGNTRPSHTDATRVTDLRPDKYVEARYRASWTGALASLGSPNYGGAYAQAPLGAGHAVEEVGWTIALTKKSYGWVGGNAVSELR
jgi:hypothetical protein